MIQVFSLTNGLDLIADVVAEDAQTITLDKPVRVFIQQDESGRLQMGLVPWAPFLIGEAETIKLYKEHFLTVPADPAPELNEQYARMYGKILAPSQKLEIVH